MIWRLMAGDHRSGYVLHTEHLHHEEETVRVQKMLTEMVELHHIYRGLVMSHPLTFMIWKDLRETLNHLSVSSKMADTALVVISRWRTMSVSSSVSGGPTPCGGSCAVTHERVISI